MASAAEEALSRPMAATYSDSVRATSFNISKSYLQPGVLRQLQTKDNAAGAFQTLAHTALIVFFGVLQWNAPSIPLRAIFVGLQAFCMAFLFTGFHEFTHHTVFSHRILNSVFGHLFGFAIFRPMMHYTFYHYNHHKYTGDPKLDPELQDSFIDLRLDNAVSYVCYLSGIPFWIDRSTTLLRHICCWVLPREDLFLTPETKGLMIQEARVYVALYVAIAAACCADSMFAVCVWQLWILPSLLAQPFLRFYLIAEHVGCPTGDDMLSNTRTTSTYTWYRWLAWQMPYHSEHHTFPFIPFHQLPKLHEELSKSNALKSLKPCVPSGELGYLGVHKGIVRSFFTKAKRKS